MVADVIGELAELPKELVYETELKVVRADEVLEVLALDDSGIALGVIVRLGDTLEKPLLELELSGAVLDV